MAIFRFFERWGCRHLGLLKVRIFNGRNGQEGRAASACQISSKSFEMWLRYGDYCIFQDYVSTAIFRQNRSNRGRDITIFRFFQDGGRPPSWIRNTCVGTTHEGYLVVFITVQNLVGIDAAFLIICTFFDFASLT